MVRVVTQEIEKYMEDIPVHAMEGMLKSRSDEYGWFVDEKFILPFFIDKRLIFRRMVFTSETIKRDPNATIEEEKAFLNEMVDLTKRKKMAHFISKAQSKAVFRTYPDAAEVVPWGTMVVDLDRSEEELFKSYESKCRNIIKKARKLGVTVEETDDIELVYKYLKDTFVRQNSPYIAPLSFFQNLVKNLPNNTKLFIAKAGEEVQGSTIVLYDKTHGYYEYSGSAANPVPGSINMLQDEIMKRLQKMGIKSYDMVGVRLNVKPGTKQAAIRRFKERFRPALVEGYAFRVVIDPMMFALHEIAIKSYFRLKGMRYKDPIEQIKTGDYE